MNTTTFSIRKSLQSNHQTPHLKDPSKEVTFVRIDDLTQEDLERRVPYLEKLHEAYEDVIKTMENVDRP